MACRRGLTGVQHLISGDLGRSLCIAWVPAGEKDGTGRGRWDGQRGQTWLELLSYHSFFPCLMQSEQKPGRSKVTPCSSVV